MKPSAGAAAAGSSGGELEDEEEGSLEMFESGGDVGSPPAVLLVFVSVACWLGVMWACVAESSDFSSTSGSSEAAAAVGCGSAEVWLTGSVAESDSDSAGFVGLCSSNVADSDSSPSSPLSSPSSRSLPPAVPLPHSLSFSDGGQVEVGVGVQESPSSLAASSLAVEAPSAPRGFRWILWWRTRLCFRVNVLSQV